MSANYNRKKNVYHYFRSVCGVENPRSRYLVCFVLFFVLFCFFFSYGTPHPNLCARASCFKTFCLHLYVTRTCFQGFLYPIITWRYFSIFNLKVFQIALAYGSCNFENFQNITRAHKSRNALVFMRFPILTIKFR